MALSLFVLAALMPVGPARAKETVALTFGWPSGLHGTVTFSVRTTRTVNGQSDNISMAGRYDFVTSAAPDGLLIQFDNVETEVEDAGSGPQAMVKAYMAKATSMPPSYVVGPDGQFVRIEGLEAFRNGIFEGMAAAFADLPPATREQIIQTMDAIFTREQLEASLASEWDSHVGTWIGAEMDEATSTSSPSTSRFPLSAT